MIAVSTDAHDGGCMFTVIKDVGTSMTSPDGPISGIKVAFRSKTCDFDTDTIRRNPVFQALSSSAGGLSSHDA